MQMIGTVMIENIDDANDYYNDNHANDCNTKDWWFIFYFGNYDIVDDNATDKADKLI